MEYYVTTPNGEKGPYSEETIRKWLREGTILRDAPVRRANEMGTLPASSVFPGEPLAPPSTTVSSDDPENVYAPPNVASELPGPAFVDPGSFGWGLVFGLCCGCFAYIGSLALDGMGSDTKRGVKVGFIIQAVLGVTYRLLKAGIAISDANH